MIFVKFTAFCHLRADLQIRLATLRKFVHKFWFCKLTITCVDLRVRLATLRKSVRKFWFCKLALTCVDLRIRLATLRKSVRKFWFCKLALTCVNLRVRLARAIVCRRDTGYGIRFVSCCCCFFQCRHYKVILTASTFYIQ